MKRATSGGSDSSASSSHHHHSNQREQEHRQSLQGDNLGDEANEKFVYRVVGDHSPLWTTLTQAQSITDYESWPE